MVEGEPPGLSVDLNCPLHSCKGPESSIVGEQMIVLHPIRFSFSNECQVLFPCNDLKVTQVRVVHKALGCLYFGVLVFIAYFVAQFMKGEKGDWVDKRFHIVLITQFLING